MKQDNLNHNGDLFLMGFLLLSIDDFNTGPIDWSLVALIKNTPSVLSFSRLEKEALRYLEYIKLKQVLASGFPEDKALWQ